MITVTVTTAMRVTRVRQRRIFGFKSPPRSPGVVNMFRAVALPSRLCRKSKLLQAVPTIRDSATYLSSTHPSAIEMNA